MCNDRTVTLPNQQVKDIIKGYGSPVYVFHKDAFIKNYQELLSTFRAIYPKYNIAYSYKTNYTPFICETVKELGGYAEVVSGMEYQLARRIGYGNDHIVFNGPVKGTEMFEQLTNGGVVNIDNLDELDCIVKFAKTYDTSNTSSHTSSSIRLKLAIRVNINIEQGFVSRFGIDAENGDLDKVFEIVRDVETLEIVGIHCHIGRSRSIDAWKNRVTQMFQLVDKYFAMPPTFIDLGSGMNSIMEPELAQQFAGHLPTYQEYANVVANAFAEKYGKYSYKEQPELITEPGTTVVSGYVSFLSTVLSIKTVKGKIFATFDGSGGNMGDICHLKQLPITVHHFEQEVDYPGNSVECFNDKHVMNADFVGYTCLEHDVMYKDYTGLLSVGDVVEFRNVGSYSNVFKPPFIYPNCAIVAVDNQNISRLIKRRETMTDLFETYCFKEVL